MPHLSGVTPTESWYASEALSKEQLCLKKCGVYLNQVQDPQLKSTVQQLMETCQRHVTSLQSIAGKDSHGSQTTM